MTRVLVHAGFHKTGTTSAQAFLAENGPVLWPVMALGLGYKIRPALSAARGFSTWRDPLSLAKFRRRFEAYLAELNLGKRDLLMSSEELSGHMPGRGDLADYSAAPHLMREIEAALRAAFPEAEIRFLFTLRRAETWAPSAYWEHVKSSRMVLDYAAFLDRYGGLDLAREASAITLDSPLETLWLEDIAGDPQGLAAPLLRRVGLSEDRWARLKPVPPKNRAPADREALIAEFLALNRSDLPPDALKAAKKALLDRADQA